jgi:hypothetical protein
MAMSQISYGAIADKTIRNFLKAVVLIDDHWSEAQDIPTLATLDPSLLNLDPQPLPPQESVDLASTAQVEKTQFVSASYTNPAYLRDIGKEITKQGFLFTGFSYTDALKDTAFKLASKSDILILDWNLGAEDSRPALDLLDLLKESGSPRFIFILTDQDLTVVRDNIVAHLGGETEGTGLIFNCGHFVFSLKNKPQAEGPNTVIASQVLEEAISGILARYGGLLQLAALELLGQYRNCLHEVLDHFHSDTDFPFILEWLEQESPIRDSHSFNALAIDEWTARVTQRFPSTDAQTITNQTVAALIVDWQKNTTPPEGFEAVLKDSVKNEKTSFPIEPSKVAELVKSLEDWMNTPNCKWPANLNGLKRGDSWSKKEKRILAMNYLGLKKGITAPIEALTALDALFQSQANFPLSLEQGTVLIAPDDIYLICISTTCDCSRPTRVKNCFVFLEAQKIDALALKDHLEGTVVAVRTKDEGNILLAVSPKPTFTYRIANPLLATEVHASATYGGSEPFIIKPVAQLRPARVQSLISLSAGKSIEVGLDRSELLRLLCKSNLSD